MWIIFIIFMKNSSYNKCYSRNFYCDIWRLLVIWIKFDFHIFFIITIRVLSYWPNYSLILLHSPSYILIFSLLSLVGASIKYLFSLFSFKVSIHVSENKVQRIYTINFWIFWTFYRHISSRVNKNIFVWLFIYFNIIHIKIFHIDIQWLKRNMFGSFCLYL